MSSVFTKLCSVSTSEISGAGGARIVVEHSDSEMSLTFRDLSLFEPDGRPVMEHFDAEILPGDRVLIVGDPATAIRLFRAVARVWPWGARPHYIARPYAVSFSCRSAPICRMPHCAAY